MIVAVSILVFSMMHLMPGDPIDLMIDRKVPQEKKNELRVQFGLDKPLHEQYLNWVGGVLRGDFGTSMRTRLPVSTMFASRMPATLTLTGISLLIELLIALPLGLLAAYKKDGIFDRVVMAVSLFFAAIPSFWTAVMLIMVFAVMLRVLPISGFSDASSYVLPIYSLHNSGFGGVYWYFTKDQDKALYESLYEAPRAQRIPIHFGEPESPALKVFYPAVFEGGGIQVEYDYMEKYGVENIPAEIDSGTCSDEFAYNLCKTITFLTEMPYFYAAKIADRAPSDMTRGEAIRQSALWTQESNRRLKDILAIAGDAMGEDNPFRDSVVKFMQDGGLQATLKMIEEDPAYQETATQAEKFDSIQCTKFYRLLSYGMLVRAAELALSRLKEATPESGEKRARLQKAQAAACALHAQLADELEENMEYSVIPIRKLVAIQLECGLKVAEYLKDR